MAFNYPYQGYSEYSTGTNSFIKFVIMLVKTYLQYDGITVEIRK